MNPDELNRMLMPRKSLQRNNSSSSIASTSSNSSTTTVITSNSNPNSNNSQTNGAPMASTDMNSWQNSTNNGTANGAVGGAPVATGARKRPQPKAPWGSRKPDGQLDFAQPGMTTRQSQVANGLNGAVNGIHSAAPILPSQAQMAAQQAMSRGPIPESMPTAGQPVLYLLSQNGTFERKTISVPFSPETLRIGRQTNVKTVPTPVNGYFDSKVLSRQHAEIWADRQGKIWIRDVKSSNGTFVNGTRLSQENRESEPHELQSSDHLELGIDIVSEDQKTIVHHKVAAKVEHAGFMSPSNNLLDMNFGDLDPANGAMMMQPQAGVPFRGRNGGQAPMAANGRMAPSNGMMGPQPNGMNHQRGGFFFSPISTEQIVKRLQNEMRTARLQSQDLGRTGQFIGALLSKDDIKDTEKPELAEQPKMPMINGNGLSFRSDNKTRFSDPPAPPPQQPLPEKPDVPSLKRGVTERPKPHTQNSSPIRQEGNMSQILQLTEALNNAKREIETQGSRMRALEEKLQEERQARELAEDLARRLEDINASKLNGSPIKPEAEVNTLEAAFEPPVEILEAAQDDKPTSDVEMSPPVQPEVMEASATHLHAQIETMVLEMKDLRQQLDTFKYRAEAAEAERDADRKSLAEMALQIRKDAEAREAASREKMAQSQANTHVTHQLDDQSEVSDGSSTMIRTPSTGSSQGNTTPGEPADPPTLSRANTITPLTASVGSFKHDEVLANSVPFASMIGVVMIGMGLMAYINGWQTHPRLDR